MWVDSTDPRICQLYHVGPLNSVVISTTCSYMHANIGKFGWSYTPGLLTIIIVHPNIVHRKHCSSNLYLLKILFTTTMFIANTDTIHNIHIGVSFFSSSKFLPMKVRQWSPISDAKYRNIVSPILIVLLNTNRKPRCSVTNTIC